VLIDDSAEKVSIGTPDRADVGTRIKGIVDEVVGVRQLIEEVSVPASSRKPASVSVNPAWPISIKPLNKTPLWSKNWQPPPNR
jgi:hypothetical protein